MTTLAIDSRAVVRFYNKRGTTEQWIKEGKLDARYYWLLLAKVHMTRRLFGAIVQRLTALSVPAG